MPTGATDRLRPMERDDLEKVLAWRNHDSVRRYMYNTELISLERHAGWFEKASLEPGRHLLVFEREGRPAGFVNLHETARGSIFDWGFYAAPDAPKGTGQVLGQAALRFAFTEAGAHRVCGQVIAYNEKSLRFHLRLGFAPEGILREHHFDGARYHDVHCFGLLLAEWRTGT